MNHTTDKTSLPEQPAAHQSGAMKKLIMVLIVMAAGRAMTIPFIARAGDGGVGDPPKVWLMPLIGDAAIGLTAVVVALLLWRRPSPAVWVIAIVWSAIGAFDALAAFVIETTAPWPEFFMLEIFGRSMFFAATALHLVIIYLLSRPAVADGFADSQRRIPIPMSTR